MNPKMSETPEQLHIFRPARRFYWQIVWLLLVFEAIVGPGYLIYAGLKGQLPSFFHDQHQVLPWLLVLLGPIGIGILVVAGYAQFVSLVLANDAVQWRAWPGKTVTVKYANIQTLSVFASQGGRGGMALFFLDIGHCNDMGRVRRLRIMISPFAKEDIATALTAIASRAPAARWDANALRAKQGTLDSIGQQHWYNWA